MGVGISNNDINRKEYIMNQINKEITLDVILKDENDKYFWPKICKEKY